MGLFLTKYGYDSIAYFIKNHQKGHSIEFFVPKYSVVLTEFMFFLSNMGIAEWSFQEKFKNDEIRGGCF